MIADSREGAEGREGAGGYGVAVFEMVAETLDDSRDSRQVGEELKLRVGIHGRRTFRFSAHGDHEGSQPDDIDGRVLKLRRGGGNFKSQEVSRQ